MIVHWVGEKKQHKGGGLCHLYIDIDIHLYKFGVYVKLNSSIYHAGCQKRYCNRYQKKHANVSWSSFYRTVEKRDQ